MAFLVPIITSITVAPNPVDANNAFLISVGVTEQSIEIEQVEAYCGTIMCGEEGM